MNPLALLANASIGRPVAFQTSGYNAATNGRRMINVASSTRGVSSLALSDGPMLTGRSRKAVMDNPRAAILVTAFVAEVIGTGLRPHFRHENVDTRRLLESEFALWTKQSSATRRLGSDGKPDSFQDFFCQQALVCRNVVEAGEGFGRLRYRQAADLSPSGLRVPLQIELIEPEQLPFWKMSGEQMGAGNIIRAGIEFNQIRERVAYHFYREHPGDSSIWPNSFEVTRVPSGDVLQVMEFIRGNQIRGITALAPILVALSDLDDFDDATRYRQRLGAYLFGWRKTMTPDDSNINLTNTAGNDSAPAGSSYTEMAPGQLNILDVNASEEFDFYAHPGVENTYKDFMRVQDQLLATAGRITYDMFTGDASQASFSSQRARLVNLRRTWRQFQRSVIEHQFCRPIIKPWLDAAALANVIDARDYKKNQEDYLNVEWLPEPWAYVDPVKDITALRMKVESSFMSREQAVASFGDDVEEVDAAIKRDHDREAALGIVPVYGASRVSETVPPGDNEELDGTEAPPAGAPPAKKPAKGAPKK
jgi:lambda family phage portal protein